jgi:adenylate cyclase
MEIGRKWLVKKLPDLSKITPNKFERYFVYIDNGVEIRVQKIDTRYEFERKVETSSLTRTGELFNITKEEFEFFKSLSTKKIIRDFYKIQAEPEIAITIYHGDFQGLKRAEVEFKTEEEANSFIPLDWFGKEITNTKLGKDKHLIQLNPSEFTSILESP